MNSAWRWRTVTWSVLRSCIFCDQLSPLSVVGQKGLDELVFRGYGGLVIVAAVANVSKKILQWLRASE
jgi:hypothetical protein